MNVYQLYSEKKAAWLRANQNATPEQIETAFRAIAERIGI
jgi:hypothetical protein